MKKRYKDQVTITVRVPVRLQRKARRVVKALSGNRLPIPETGEKVAASIAVLALRGLENQVDCFLQSRERVKSSRRICKEQGLDEQSGKSELVRSIELWEMEVKP